MGIEIDSGRIIATNALGQTVLDTDEGQFVVTDYVTGTVARPGYSASCQNFNNFPLWLDTYPVVRSINPAANVVRGSFFVTTTNGEGSVSSVGWFNAGGSYVHFAFATSGLFVEGMYNCASFAIYTFIAGGGLLKLRENITLQSDFSTNNVNRTIIMQPPTFQYRLFCGKFI